MRRIIARLLAVGVVCAVGIPAPAQECLDYVTSLDLGCYAGDVALNPGYAYVKCSSPIIGTSLVAVIDVSTPVDPVAVGSVVVATDNGTGGVAAFGDYVYVAANHSIPTSFPNALRVVDVSVPDNPVEVGAVPIDQPSLGHVVATEGFVYVARGDQVLVFDVTVPADPIEVGEVAVINEGAVVDFSVFGDYAYLLYDSGIFIFDVGDPTQPVYLSFYGSGWGHHELTVDPTSLMAFTAWSHYVPRVPYFSGVDAVSVADPSNPIFTDDLQWNGGGGGELLASGGYLYRCWGSYLIAHHVPDFWPNIEVTSEGEALAAGWGHLYVAEGNTGLSILRECGPFYDGFDLGDWLLWSAVGP